MDISTEEFKDKSFAKILSTILISFISLPLIIMGILYFSNEGFKDNANKILSGLPGNIGGYFQTIPTKKEKEELKRKIAQYYINLDEDRIIDKLLIIKGENQQLFNDLVILMSKENANKMKKVKENLEAPKFKKDPFNRILAEIDRENEEKINEMQKYYTSLTLAKAVQEIERTHAANEITTDELIGLFERLKPEQAAEYLFYLDMELGKQIKYRLPNRVLQNIEKKLEESENNRTQLFELASIYENKHITEAVAELGDSNKYSIEQLAVIYKNLTLNKSSKILSNVDDNDFVLALFNEINHLEELQKDKQNISSAIMKGITIYREYNQKIDELSAVYQKTDIEELTKMIETMLKRNEVYQKHTLNESEEIIFTEEQLVVDVLDKLKTNTVAEILKNLKEGDRILLSKKLFITPEMSS
ncbi:MAG: hypothetical protein ACOCG5_01645 [Candidatus Alkaliphilus sp. MAG34]|nr:hypothetical protein [Clostridiales bacterium]